MRTGPNIRLREDGRWEARYRKGRYANGRIIYGYVYGCTQDEAEQRRAVILSTLPDYEDDEKLRRKSKFATVNPEVHAYNSRKNIGVVKMADALDEELAISVEQALSECRNGQEFAFYLCLQMGISTAEAAALRYSDFNMEENLLSVSRQMIKLTKAGEGEQDEIVLMSRARRIPIPEIVQEAVYRHKIFFKRENSLLNSPEKAGDGSQGLNDNYEHYLLTDSSEPVDNLKKVSRICKSVLINLGLPVRLHPDALRSTFIRRALEAGLNIETISDLTGLERNVIVKKYGFYIRSVPMAINRIGEHTKLPASRDTGRARQLNLLILGAGSHGHAVYELAKTLGVFREIAFLDDNVKGTNIIGRLEEYRRFQGYFPAAFVAIGNSSVRKNYIEKLRDAGFLLPCLIHPDTSILGNCEIGDATIIMAKATVNATRVGCGVIIGANAMLSFKSVAEDYAHIDCSGIVAQSAVVKELSHVESGEVVKAEGFASE